MSTSTYFTPPPINPACNLPVVCSAPANYVTHTNGTTSGSVEINTQVTAEFGGRTLNICKTARTATYSNTYTMPFGCYNDYYSSNNVSDKLEHESIEILYVNNYHNVLLYKKFNASLSLSASSPDYIGTNTTGGYPMVGKVCFTPTISIREQIILSRATNDETLYDVTSSLSGHYLVLIGLPDPIPEMLAKAMDADLDIKSHGGYYSGDWFYPPWIELVMGKGTGRDAIWYREYYDQYANPI